MWTKNVLSYFLLLGLQSQIGALESDNEKDSYKEKNDCLSIERVVEVEHLKVTACWIARVSVLRNACLNVVIDIRVLFDCRRFLRINKYHYHRYNLTYCKNNSRRGCFGYRVNTFDRQLQTQRHQRDSKKPEKAQRSIQKILHRAMVVVVSLHNGE